MEQWGKGGVIGKCLQLLIWPWNIIDPYRTMVRQMGYDSVLMFGSQWMDGQIQWEEGKWGRERWAERLWVIRTRPRGRWAISNTDKASRISVIFWRLMNHESTISKKISSCVSRSFGSNKKEKLYMHIFIQIYFILNFRHNSRLTEKLLRIASYFCWMSSVWVCLALCHH